MDYIIVVQNPAYRISENSFATESAFAEHLRELRKSIGAKFSRLVLIAPEIDDGEYTSQRQHLGIVDVEQDQIAFLPAYPARVSAFGFWLKHATSVWKMLNEALPQAAVVHSGMATDIRWPLLAMTNLAAARLKKPVLFIVDIDFREHTSRCRRLGLWSMPRYLGNLLVLDPFKWLQVELAVRHFNLILLKSESMVRDFGRGQSNVKNFYDTVHAEAHILPQEQVLLHLAKLRDPRSTLQLCYFGRLVTSKGVDRMLQAMQLVRDAGCDVRLMIIGDGPDRADLQKQASTAGLDDRVTFLPQVSYGEPLFEKLSEAHLTLAAPLTEDTPRAAFDSMARGLPILAFDISYFRDLAFASGAVALAAWPSVSDLAKQIVALNLDRNRIADMAEQAIDFARENTQQVWLKRRVDWTYHHMMGEAARNTAEIEKMAGSTPV